MTEHTTLNFSKGVIYSNDLRGIEENLIVEELSTQKVVSVKKILKKVNDSLIETGLIIITFATPNLPEQLFIGYERVKIRPYIPSPLRCYKCFRYGHITKICNNEQICPHCSICSHTI